MAALQIPFTPQFNKLKWLVTEGNGEDQEQDNGWPEQYVDAQADKQASDQAAYVVVGVTWRG
jgi:hypothetical protein